MRKIGESIKHWAPYGIHADAIRAITLAQSRGQIGAYAARRNAIKHGILPLYRLACQLEAARKL